MELDDPLGDMFGIPSKGSSQPASQGALQLEEVEFDPDRPGGGTARVHEERRPDPTEKEARSGPSAASSVDPVELKRRIQGVGSEAPGLWVRARQLASAGCSRGGE